MAPVGKSLFRLGMTAQTENDVDSPASDNESQLQMLRQLELSEENFRAIQKFCRSRGIIFLSTAFDEDSVDFLADLNVSVFKVPSGEITNTPLQELIGAKRKPVTLSTGMATLGQIGQAMRCLSQFGWPQIGHLQFVSEYPADVSKTNLRAVATLTQCFGVPVGLSDHSLGIEVAIAAVTLGATIVEKHFASGRSSPGRTILLRWNRANSKRL